MRRLGFTFLVSLCVLGIAACGSGTTDPVEDTGSNPGLDVNGGVDTP